MNGEKNKKNLTIKYTFMTKYRVLYFDTIMDLETQVNDRLKEGWLLSGGVSVTINAISGLKMYYQAIYKPIQ